MSACVATTFLGTLQFNRATISSRQHLVEAVSTFLPMVTWFDSTFSSRLNLRPKTWALANCSLPLSFSPSDLGRDPEERMRFISWTSSSTLSGVLEIKHKESPDCFRSSWTPNTLQIESKGRSLWVDTFHPKGIFFALGFPRWMGFPNCCAAKGYDSNTFCTSWHSGTAACHAMCNESYLSLFAVGALWWH